jgi:hypothetical protein
MSYSQAFLKKIAEISALKILNAREGVEYFSLPYRHLVIDNFFEIDFAKELLRSFPPISDDGWEHSNDQDIEIKFRTNWASEFDIPEGIVDGVRVLNSASILRAMAIRFGIAKIIPDPYFTGGGLNVTLPGGLLDVHVDGNYHDATGLNRRLNAILYLNPEWESAWGGEFGVYDAKGEVCLKRIAPLFNRLIIFDSHDYSFHGLPEPLNFPEGASGRKSIILYYYTKENRPPEHTNTGDPHSALWVKRGLLDKRGNKKRTYE